MAERSQLLEGSPYRTALVTGASRGIGAAVVEALAGAGLDVWALARSKDALATLATRTGCTPLAVDVTDTGALERAIGGLEVDVLVANAGVITATGKFHKLTAAEIDGMLDVNIKAVMHTIRLVLGGMIERRRGHVFIVTSVAARHPYADIGAYNATKAALTMLAQCLRLELVGTGVRLTELAPGRVQTEIYLDAMGGDPARMQESLYANKRVVMPKEVADVVLHTLSLPPHVDLSIVEIVPTDQAFGGLSYAEAPADGERR